MKKNFMIRFLFSLVVMGCFIPVVTISASELTDSLMNEGNSHYMKRQYNQAELNYMRLVNLGFESADLYYNLANSLYKQEKFAKAILYYEKALLLKPGDDDISQNLALANVRIVDKINALPDFFMKRWFNAIRSMFSPDEWAVTGFVLFVVSLSFYIFYFTGFRISVRKLAFTLGSVLMIFAVVSVLFMFSRVRTIRKHNNAIIMVPSVNARSSTDDQSTNVFILHEGTKVKILDSIQNWKEIQIADGNVGFVPSESLEEI